MPSLTRIPGTRHLLLIWNNSSYDHTYDHCGKRTPLTVAVSRDEGATWECLKNIETDPLFEFSNIGCSYLSEERILISYFTSKMEDPNPPGRLGRKRMSLKGAITTIDWIRS